MDVFILICRYLRTRRIALVAAVFVSIAVALMIVVVSAMDGFRARIHANVRGVEPDLAIRMLNPVHEHFQQVEDELRSDLTENGGVIEALSPRLVTVGFLKTEIQGLGGLSTNREGVKIIGIDWEKSIHVIPLRRIIKEVDTFHLKSPKDWATEEDDPFWDKPLPGILVGRVLGGKVGLTTREKISFGRTNKASIATGIVKKDAGQAQGVAVELANLDVWVAGAFDSGRDDFDSVHLLMDRQTLFDLRYPPGSNRPDCTTVHAKLTAGAAADIDAVAEDLRRRHPNMEFLTWAQRNQGLMDALDVEKAAMTVVTGFIVVLTVCLIFGLLYMLVIEKTRDVGVLRSMGFSGRKVVFLFLGYGTALGLIGAGLGAALGVYLVENLNEVLQALGFQVFNPAVPYRFRGIPTILDPTQVTVIAVGAAVVTMLAGAFAAWRAAVIDPVRCLRYE